jgi:hypothetical protein
MADAGGVRALASFEAAPLEAAYQEIPGICKRPAGFSPAGRPVDCLGLTKRWSLNVASHGDSRVGGYPRGGKPSRDRRDACLRNHRLVCGL